MMDSESEDGLRGLANADMAQLLRECADGQGPYWARVLEHAATRLELLEPATSMDARLTPLEERPSSGSATESLSSSTISKVGSQT